MAPPPIPNRVQNQSPQNNYGTPYYAQGSGYQGGSQVGSQMGSQYSHHAQNNSSSQVPARVNIEASTFQRFKEMELNHVTITSIMDEKIKELELKNQELVLRCVTRDSLISDLEKQKMQLYNNQLYNDQQSHFGSQSQHDNEYNDLLNQLNYERKVNTQMDAKLLELQRQTRPGNQDEVRALQYQLDEERKANKLLDQRALDLLRELDTLKQQKPLPVSSPATNQDTEKLRIMKSTLENERYSFEQTLQQKQVEIAGLYRQLDDVEEKPPQQNPQELESLRRQIQIEQQKSYALDVQLKKAIVELKSSKNNVQDPSDLYERNIPTGAKIQSKTPPKDFEAELWPIYLSAEKTNAGRLDTGELHDALSKGPWPKLKLRTVWVLIRLVDSKGDFCETERFPFLWNFCKDCKSTFEKFDVAKRSATEWGYIPSTQLEAVFAHIQFKIPKKALQTLLKRKGQESIF
jgi:hypothetical protein